jgi:hypothetical protein
VSGDRSPRYAYISYAPSDSVTALVVRAALESAGIEVWDATRLLPGQDRRAVIRQTVSCDALAFISLFSRTALAASSSHHHEELSLAIEELRRRPSQVPWLIPVRADDCEIPPLEIGAGRTLRSLESADVYGAGREAGLDRLVAVVAQIQDHGRDARLRERAASRSRPGRGIRLPAARVQLAVLSVALAAGAAAYAATREPGVPAYYQTGPAARMQVPPSPSPNCDDIAPGTLVSPADHIFSDVSEIRPVSTGGRTAYLMQGYLGDTTYDWLVYEPDGKHVGMWLRWQVHGGAPHYCTVSITNMPPADLAEHGISLISSMAVPALVNGQVTSFRACIWYTIQQGVIPHACWPPQS